MNNIVITKTNEVSLKQPMEYFQGLMPELLDFAVQVLGAVILLVIGVKLIGILRKIIRKALERHGVETGVVQFLDTFLKYLLYIVLGMTLLQKFGVETTSVVAIMGSAGVAIGLALQGSLSNFAGGVLILILHPFKVGDYIIQGDKEGTVVEISLFYTTLLTSDNRRVVIPNGQLSDNSLVNVTAEPERRLDLQVGISYDSSIQQAKMVLEHIASKDPDVLSDPAPFTAVKELGSSEVTMLLRIWVKTEKYWEVKFRMNEEIKLGLEEAGVQIPFPQLDVFLKH